MGELLAARLSLERAQRPDGVAHPDDAVRRAGHNPGSSLGHHRPVVRQPSLALGTGGVETFQGLVVRAGAWLA